MSVRLPNDPPVKADAKLDVAIATDGTPRGSAVTLTRDNRLEETIDASKIAAASCSVKHLPGGARCITATVWVAP